MTAKNKNRIKGLTVTPYYINILITDGFRDNSVSIDSPFTLGYEDPVLLGIAQETDMQIHQMVDDIKASLKMVPHIIEDKK